MTPPARWAKRWQAARRRWQAGPQRWHRSLRHSLKWRLVAVFLILALATTGVFLFGMQRVLQTGWQAFARPLVADYVDRLAAEIGTPPDAARARALTERLPITVRIDGPQVQFDSHPGEPHRGAADRGRWHRSDAGGGPGEATEGRGAEAWGLMRRTADGHRIRFGLRGPPRPEGPRAFGWVTLVVLLGLVWAAFAYVRRLLAPLHAIGAGVARFGAGDFARPIQVRRRDELGELAGRINHMATNLQGMLDAKRALLLALSHELRSPLTRARVNAELVAASEARDALLRDLGQMRDLITDLLESERLAQGHAALQTEAVDLAALLHETLAQQFAGVALEVQAEPGPGPVRADPVRLRLLLRNLVDNALRHNAGAARPPCVSLTRDAGGSWCLAVRDFGPGASDAQLAHMAEPFYRADAARTRAAGGVGLGLYLCRRVAEAHGGRLLIERAEPGLRVAMVWTPPPA